MIDLVVRGGQVVTADRVAELDIAVQGERILAVAEPGVITEDARRVIDASGKIVVPGGIDPHTHIAWPIPETWAKREGAETQSPEPASMAAAFGGTTTFVDFAAQGPDTLPLDALDQRIARFQGHSYVDYTFHLTLRGEIPFEALDQIGDVVARGVPSFKIYTTFGRRTPSSKVDDGHLWGAMNEVARHGGIMVVHAEDDDIVEFMVKKLNREGRNGAENIHLVHNNLSEDVSFRNVIRLARHTGVGVYFVHVTAKEGVAAIAEARADGLPIYGEALHNYLAFTSDDYSKPEGQLYHTYPALKFADDRDALWDGVLGGSVATVATDEYTTHKSTKLAGQTIDDVCGGHNGIETRMPIMFTEGVKKRGMSLRRFVEVTSTNAARLMGMYPRKGVLAPGSDADIVLIDPNVRKKLALSDLHADTDYSIWEGWELEGYPVTTILRGKVIVEAGDLKGSPSDGKFLERKIADDVLKRPAL